MAFDHTPDLDGAMSVSETEAECEQIQREGFQLEDIEFGTKPENGTVFLINKTGFNEKVFGRLDDLHFYQVKDTDDIDEVKEEKEELGWTFMLDTQIYAQNLTKRVLIFGKEE